jgi:hypothetical protein
MIGAVLHAKHGMRSIAGDAASSGKTGQKLVIVDSFLTQAARHWRMQAW